MFVPITLDDETVIYIETKNQNTDIERVSGEFNINSEKFLTGITSFSQSLICTLQDISPSRMSVEFSVNAIVKSGQLFALVGSGEVDGAVKVTVEWSKNSS